MTNQRIVGVVPFRPLRVEPDTAVDDEIAELGQQGHQQLLQQVDLVDGAAGIEDQFAIGTDRGDALGDARCERAVVRHRLLRVRDDLSEAPDPIRHVRVAVDGPAQQFAEASRMELSGLFQELQQVDDLVIAPVADVTP
ncbi:MAG: hypothetical protein OEW50_02355, partial [Gammaproteobacteria bacterium]|nr:hypothetical protein [Gammaproteobacteria bacterium]